jgi:uncharacterized metal-binding protein YceD (DUF177 family)
MPYQQVEMSPSSSWSVPVRVEDIPETGRRFDLEANEATRTALARVAAVNRIPRLEAHFDVVRHGRDGLRVGGTISATVAQTCVVTLEPIESEVAESVDLTFMPGAHSASDGATEQVGVSPAREPPETLVDGTIDLGAIATEFLLLGIDPYPRKAGAVFAAPLADDPAAHPFAALAALKTGKQD